ncbi:hypothetical protein JXA85_02140 [Candidatus Woesearchaeota archaeon]|nr:hypothetical protein [Candidatus Woesearchaeota archaeon]
MKISEDDIWDAINSYLDIVSLIHKELIKVYHRNSLYEIVYFDLLKDVLIQLKWEWERFCNPITPSSLKYPNFKKIISVKEISRINNALNGFAIMSDKSVSGIILELNRIVQKNSYKNYLKTLHFHFAAFRKSQQLSFIPKLERLECSSDNKTFALLYELCLNQEKSLKSFHKVAIKHLKGVISIQKDMRRITEEYDSLAEKINHSLYTVSLSRGQVMKAGRRPESNTFKIQLSFLKSQIKLLYRRKEELKSFTEKYERKFKGDSASLHAFFPDASKMQNLANEINKRLPFYENGYANLKDFHKAYECDDQEGIFRAAKKLHHNVIGTHSGLTAYAGVSESRKRNSTWHDAGVAKIDPKGYALRLHNIVIRNGYEPSSRTLNDNISGVDKIKNIYFFTGLHFFYGPATVSWNLDKYCVFQQGREYYILTKKNVPPGMLTLHVLDPCFRVNQIWMRDVLQKLDGLGIRYVLKTRKKVA